MTEKLWLPQKVHYCDHVGCEVALEIEKVYPSEHLPDQPGRILAHRCASGKECNLFRQAACVWAGTNPVYDPLE